MRRGIWIHACLEAVNQAENYHITLDTLVEQALTMDIAPEEVEALRSEVELIIDGRIRYWEAEGGSFEPVLVEKELTYHAGGHDFTATLDYLARFPSGLWIVEVKSTTDIPPALWRGVDPQTAIQYMAARESGYDVEGVMFEYLNTRLPSVPRVKKDGHFYANTAVTTSWQFDKAVSDVLQSWNDPTEDATQYLDHMRRELVNDGAFYQRWAVARPEECYESTKLDAVHLVTHAQLCERTGYWPRSYNALTCRRFCDYGELCMSEYLHGGLLPAAREADFIVDDGSREGETARAAVAALQEDNDW